MTTSADVVRLALVTETVYGDTPATPSFNVVRLTGESLAFSPTTTISAGMNPKRMVEDSILTGGAVSGSINFELSKELWFDTMLAAVMCNDWTVNVLKIGTILKSVTVQKTIPTTPTTDDFHAINGAIANGMTLTIAPNAAITGSFDMLADSYDVSDTNIAGALYIDPIYNPIFTAPLVTDVEIDGIAATAKCFNNIVLNINNNSRALECIGTLGAREMALGRAEVTLTFSLYYADSEMLEKLITQDDFAMSFTVNDNAGTPNAYIFEIPKMKLTQCNVVAGGTGEDVIADCVGQALLDTVSGTALTITRAP
jgi:hypothetical protein